MKIIAKMMFMICLNYFIMSSLISCIQFHNVTFLSTPCIIPYSQYYYHTCNELKVLIDGRLYEIPGNFKTDLATIPQPLWSFVAPQYASYVAPSILHDFLYNCGRFHTRKFADEVLYSALISRGVNPITAANFYWAVRIFGGSHYGSYNLYCTRIVDARETAYRIK